MNRDPAQTPENPMGGGAPAGNYGQSGQNLAQTPAADFRSENIVNTQAAQEKEYFQPEQPRIGRWARLRKWLKEHRKAALAILLGILVLLGLLIWLIVWLVSSVTSSGNESVELIGEATEEDYTNAVAATLNVDDLMGEPTTSDEELVTAINTELNALTTKASQFFYLLEIASMLANTGRIELSFEYLNTIDTATLDNSQLFTYYACWATIYEQLEDEEQVDYYNELMEGLGMGSSAGVGAP